MMFVLECRISGIFSSEDILPGRTEAPLPKLPQPKVLQ
ncbi:hypothetical protein Alg130_11933 [Pyrenophora tritici-repentis]|nr:hypothetical protein Alg130_11933 [Pyrenophora tritici-repentis]KAI0603954.1 hypothetical protein TUN205_11799 [Pyrenophora tritici-repentis]